MSPAFLVALALISQTPTEEPAPEEWKLTPEQERAIEDDDARNRPVTPPPHQPSQVMPQYDPAAQNRPSKPRDPNDAPDPTAELDPEEANAQWYRDHPQSTTPPPPPRMRRALAIMAGYGLAYSTDGSGHAGGFIGEVAHIWYVRRWFSPRVYGGALVTGTGNCNGRLPCDVANQIGFLGGQVHLVAPIPYFGPFIDLGFGASFGTINDIAGGPASDRRSGAFPHLKLGAGIAFGERNQYEIGLQAIDHFTAHSVAGGFMLGLRFPL